MFERAHHQRIARVLGALHAELLRGHGCLFGGGTCIALRYGEFRESVDIDFLVSDATGYRQLRQLLTGEQGMAAITRPGAIPLETAREIRADQYGIRTVLKMDGQPIKFEIVREARITLDTPAQADALCGVSTLTVRDLARAIDRIKTRQGWLERCMQAMAMDMPRALLWQKLRALLKATSSPPGSP